MSNVAAALRQKAQELLDLADTLEAEELHQLFKSCSARGRKRILEFLAAEGATLPEVK